MSVNGYRLAAEGEAYHDQFLIAQNYVLDFPSGPLNIDQFTRRIQWHNIGERLQAVRGVVVRLS